MPVLEERPLSAKSASLADVMGECADAIRACFKDTVKITILVRNVDHPSGTRDVVMTDDAVPSVLHAIGRARQ